MRAMGKATGPVQIEIDSSSIGCHNLLGDFGFDLVVEGAMSHKLESLLPAALACVRGTSTDIRREPGNPTSQ